jgi:hypothetical protein
MVNEPSGISAYEVPIRLGFFFGVFAPIAAWELVARRRALTDSEAARWISHLGLVFLNSLVLRLLFPAAAVGTPGSAAEQRWGLLNHFHVPFWPAVLCRRRHGLGDLAPGTAGSAVWRQDQGICDRSAAPGVSSR